MRLYHIRFDETTLERLQDILIARAQASGREVSYGQYAPWRNVLTKSQVVRDVLDEEWQRLMDNGQITRAKVAKCSRCGRTECPGKHGQFWCEG
jgi:hypothetical protein